MLITLILVINRYVKKVNISINYCQGEGDSLSNNNWY